MRYFAARPSGERIPHRVTRIQGPSCVQGAYPGKRNTAHNQRKRGFEA